MTFCLNCGNHKTCDCAGPPMGVNTDRDDTFGCQPPEVKDLRHPATKWFDQQIEEGNLPRGTHTVSGEFGLRTLLTKAFNAGASYACREILDVIPDFDDCEPDDLRYAAEDAYGICKAWLD